MGLTTILTENGTITTTDEKLAETYMEKPPIQAVQHFRNNVRPPKWHEALTGKYTWRNVGMPVDRPVNTVFGPLYLWISLFAAALVLSVAMVVYWLVMGDYHEAMMFTGISLVIMILSVLTWYCNKLDLDSAWRFASWERKMFLAMDDNRLLRVLENSEDNRESTDDEVIS